MRRQPRMSTVSQFPRGSILWRCAVAHSTLFGWYTEPGTLRTRASFKCLKEWVVEAKYDSLLHSSNPFLAVSNGSDEFKPELGWLPRGCFLSGEIGRASCRERV